MLSGLFALYIVLFALLTQTEALVPSDIDPATYTLPVPPPLAGPLTPNTKLTTAQELFNGLVSGPIAMDIEPNTSIFYSYKTGKVIQLENGSITKEVALNDGTITEEISGMRRISAQLLFVSDTQRGLLKVDLANGTAQVVLSADKVVDGASLGYMHAVDFVGDLVFIPQASTRWNVTQVMYALLENKGDGRLLQANLTSGEVKVAVNGLHFPHGVQMHPDGCSVLIPEVMMVRIIRYHFKGPKSGQTEIFSDNLPGYPSKLRLSSTKKSIYVPLNGVRNSPNYQSLFDLFAPYPQIRKYLANVWIFSENIALGLKLVQLIYSQLKADNESKALPYNTFFALFGIPYGMLLELDLNGKIIRSYQDPEGVIFTQTSQLMDDSENLYAIASNLDFIAKILKK